MDISSLYSLSEWYCDNVIGKGLSNVYKKSVSQLNTAMNPGPSNNKTTVVDRKRHIKNAYVNIKKELMSCYKLIEPYSFDLDQKKTLQAMGVYQIIEPDGVDMTYDLLEEKNNIQHVSARFVDLVANLENADERFKFLRETLHSLGCKNESQVHSEKVVTRLVFHNDASINNVVDLHTWSQKLEVIASGFSRVLGQAPEDFEIIGASKGSIIFDLLLNVDTLKMLGDTIKGIADFTLTIAEIELARRAIMQVQDKSPDASETLLKDLSEQIDNMLDEKLQSLADDIFEKYAVDKVNKESKTHLQKSMRNVNYLLDKGADIQFNAPSALENIEHAEQVKLVNEALLQLKNNKKQKLLENKKDD